MGAREGFFEGVINSVFRVFDGRRAAKSGVLMSAVVGDISADSAVCFLRMRDFRALRGSSAQSAILRRFATA